ncbi:MAG: MotA/TolQ/ExbB proton channel family protein [Prevotellaceae bacterium]|jgi:biopolymer transport protein ExbB|nr:MotA/TolQ/ExbB proton channel family protein [Prevotellaceae bacterium]
MVQDGLASQVEDLTAAGDAASKLNSETGISLLDLFLQGGFTMWILLGLSFIAAWIFVERLFAIIRASRIDHRFMEQIKQYVHNGQINYAIDLCRMTNSPIARLIEKGLERVGRPLSDVQTAVENMGNLEVGKLERGLPMLATVSGGAPMIGFLGTVIGMILAFYNMAAAGSSIDISMLSGGIYLALVTTVGGLIVGIMAFFGYNYLVSRIERIIYKMEANTIEFMDLLNEPV